MNPELKTFISQYANLHETELDDIAARFKKREIRKKQFLLRQGEICKDLIFVRSGCLRLYYVADGVEVSVWFSFPNNSAVEISSFISQNPSDYYIQAVEDSLVYSLSKIEIEKLYLQYPKMQEMMRRYLEDVVMNLINRFTSLQKDTAETRYKNLLEKPEYMQTIPQKYLASFIGITPTSLSRIRKGVK